MQPTSKYDTTLKERDRSFRGTAKVDFVHLQFEDCYRQLDLKNVSRLVKVFEKEGCARLKPENRVPAIIPDEVLKAALQKNGLNLDLNRSPFYTDPPRISFPADLRIQCLHGQHRIRSAEKYLPKADRWWVVDLFSSELSEEAKQELREQCNNGKKNSDGELYRRIRHYSRASDSRGQRRWKARISQAKERELNYVEARLLRPLDRLLPFHGLWEDFNLSLLWRMLSWRCWEEIERYLDYIWRFWYTVTSGERRLEHAVDRYTVERLQGRNPRLSANDREEIRWLFANGTLFASVSGKKDRADLLEAVLSTENAILSFKTFSEDVKYLEPIVVNIRKFLSPSSNTSLESRARELHSDRRAGVIQRGEGDFVSCAVVPSDNGRFSYVQLCLFCFRQFLAFEEASSPSGGIEMRKGKQKKGSDDIWTPLFVERLAELAYRLGFDSSKIRDSMQEENQTEGIARSIHSYILGKSCDVDENLFADAIRRLRESIKGSKAYIYDKEPELSTDSGSLNDDNMLQQEITSERFYLPTLCKAGIGPPKRFISLFAAQREAFLAFFGHDILTMYEVSGGSPEFNPAAAAQAGFQSSPGAASPPPTQANASNLLNTSPRRSLATANPTGSEEDPTNVSAYNRYESIIGGTLQAFSSLSSGEYHKPIWEYTDFRHASELMQALATADNQRWNEGTITFWKLEDSCSIKVSRQQQALEDVLSRIAAGHFGNIRVPQLFGMVVEDQFRYYRPPHFPALEAMQAPSTFRNVVFLMDSFVTEELSLWQTLMDGGSFKEKSIQALSSDLISRSSNKRKHTSSMYSDDSVANKRLEQQKKLRR